MIIDAQVHVWAPETSERPWFSHETHLPEPFGYKDLIFQMKGAGVDRAVLVPPGWEGDRVDFAIEGAKLYPDNFRVMGRIPIERPEIAPMLSRWKSQSGMLGIRLTFQKAHNRAWLTDGTSDWFWPLAEKHEIPVMVFAPGQSAEIREIALNHPKLRLIIDHMGLNREKDKKAAAVIENLASLADLANIYVKVTSIPLYSTEPYPFRGLHQALHCLISAFGPERAFWGTDLTRIWSLLSYRQCVTLFTEELEFLKGDDLEWVMGRSVAQCLSWRMTP